MIPDFDPGLAELRELGEVHVAEEQREAATSNVLAVLTGLLMLWSFALHPAGVQPADGDGCNGRSLHAPSGPGQAAGAPPAPADTRASSSAVWWAQQRRGHSVRLLRGMARAAAEVVQADASDLLDTYEAAQFGPKVEAGTEKKRTRRWAAVACAAAGVVGEIRAAVKSVKHDLNW